MDKTLKTEKLPAPEIYDDPPPPYESDAEDDGDSILDEDEALHFQNLSIDRSALHSTSTTHKLPLPVVIPQTNKSPNETTHAPFLRCTSPFLTAANIPPSQFVAFLDGLNESVSAHAAYQSVGIFSSVLSSIPIGPAKLAGRGLKYASGQASAATSRSKTKAYLEATNRDLFHPVGLHAAILTTGIMCRMVGFSEDLGFRSSMTDRPGQLGMAENSRMQPYEDMNSANVPCMKRLQALHGYIAPLDFDVPASVAPDGLIQKMDAARVAREEMKLDARDSRRQAKMIRREAKVDRLESRAEAREHAMQVRLTALEEASHRRRSLVESHFGTGMEARESERQREKLERKMGKQVAKADRKIEKRERKMDRKDERMTRRDDAVEDKMRWLVISTWEGPGSRSDLQSVSSEEDNIHEEVTRTDKRGLLDRKS